jgi:hypothetical protein
MKIIKDLLRRAGSEGELRRWIKLAMPGSRRRGRPAGSSKYSDADDDALLMAETLKLTAETLKPGKDLSLHAAIKLVASGGPLSWTKLRGASQSAMVKRLMAKAHAEHAKPREPLTETELLSMFRTLISWLSSDNYSQRLLGYVIGTALFSPNSHSD